MYGNAATLPTTLGGGAHGHVGLIMKAKLYMNLSQTAYVSPTETPLTLVISPTTESAARQQLRDQHTEEQLIHTNHINMDDALKNQLLDAVEDPYVSKLRNRYTKYMGVMTRNLLYHLMDWYGNITAADFKANEARINEAFDHSRTTDVFSQRIDDAAQYADDGKNLFTAKKYCKRHFTLLTQPACTKRHERNDKKGDAGKTWTNFKRHFAAEYHKIGEQQCVSGESGFNSAQLAHETTDTDRALGILALSATADHNIVANLIAINKKFVETNTALVAQVKSLVATNAWLANTQDTKYPKPTRATITR